MALEEASLKQPLGILCQCARYAEIAKNCVPYTVGTQNSVTPKFDIDPIASAAVIWVKNSMEYGKEFYKPILDCAQCKFDEFNASNIDKAWIPVLLDLVSPKELRPNLSYLHTAAQSTQSAELSTLTDMLPHKGRVVKQKDIIWGKDFCLNPIKMTDEPATHFPRVRGCFSVWADQYTSTTGYPAY
ncbi:hypothetical protein KPH14_001049 [Odynerus spinipes]|uniref:Uncharacterized protein n=1 Tax=Odynerus spinipes TaxID=1348599 RepID=A0AAD9R921_9HYME|nr:hypothetical protein KPH14_001049 [Odynerus spinipes]